MVIYAARTLKPYDNDNALIGIGIPTLASKVARALWCKDMHVIIENGSFDADMVEIPYSLFGARVTYGCGSQHDTCIALSSCKRGAAKIGFIGGAQVDKYGNVNTTHIGPINKRKNRIAGSGGAVDIGAWCENTNIVIKLTKRGLVDQVDYITTPGWVCVDNTEGKREWVRREKLGLKGGPRSIITDMGIFHFGEDGIAYLHQYYPGLTAEKIKENTGFDVDISRAAEAEPITQEEIDTLRNVADPSNIYKTR
jgi:glutaconate CoA-transferase subunit B